MIFFKIFEEYIEYLNTIFELFNRIEITFKNLKIYFDYPSIIFLKQRIDGLNIIYIENCIAIFKNFQFPQTLKDLKKYLKMIKWLRQHISWFAQRSEILQNRKITLLRQKPFQNSVRKNYTVKILIGNSINLEIEFFNSI
jgi:hypothetical protein